MSLLQSLKQKWYRGVVRFVNPETGIGIIEDDLGELKFRIIDGQTVRPGAREPELVKMQPGRPHNGSVVFYAPESGKRERYINDNKRWVKTWYFVRDWENAKRIIAGRSCYRVIQSQFGKDNKPKGQGEVVWQGTYVEDSQLARLWDTKESKIGDDYIDNFRGQLHFERLEGETWIICPDPRRFPPIYRKKQRTR